MRRDESAHRGPDAPTTSIAFDRAAGYYDATRGYPPGVDARVAALIAEAGALGPTSRVLEIGVGTGRIALPLSAHVARVFGVDLAAPMLEKLRAKRGQRRVAVARADAARLPLRDASVDAVLGVHVFHLIPRWREVLEEVRRVLRPGGVLLHAADEQSAFRRAWRERIEVELGTEHVGVPRARFEDFPEEHGWRLDGPVRRLAFETRLTPQDLLDRMARRTWSVTWRLSDAELERTVTALREELLARFGDLGREVALEAGFWVRAYRWGGA